MVSPVTATKTLTTKSRRATALPPDERRSMIVAATLPLLLEHGDRVTSRQIAEAAGIAEGTIFRVFPDKAALLMAAAEETMNPSAGREELAAALDGISDLRERVLVATEMAHARSERVVAVMMALRGVWTAQAAERRDHPHRPPEFMRSSRRAVLDRLTDVFEPHRAELTVTPRKAALLLHALVLGARHPGVEPEAVLSPREIADALLDGIATPSSKETD
jgi:AcrR family transcriptional regulator